jgi:hypothetical protein
LQDLTPGVEQGDLFEGVLETKQSLAKALKALQWFFTGRRDDSGVRWTALALLILAAGCGGAFPVASRQVPASHSSRICARAATGFRTCPGATSTRRSST